MRAFQDCLEMTEALDFEDLKVRRSKQTEHGTEKDTHGKEHATEEAVRGARQVVDEL
jgi:hypothetical protein